MAPGCVYVHVRTTGTLELVDRQLHNYFERTGVLECTLNRDFRVRSGNNKTAMMRFLHALCEDVMYYCLLSILGISAAILLSSTGSP
jgi:hypothetical protein